MKKVFNLSVILALLVATFSFTSCGDKESDINVTLNGSSFTEGVPVTGSVTADNRVETIKIEKKDANNVWQPERTIQRSQFGMSTGVIVADGNNNLVLTISGLGVGSYTIQAIDKDGNESQKVSFTVTSSNPIQYTSKTVNVVAGNTYGFQHGSTTGTFTVIEATNGSVKISINGTVVTLSDQGTSYLGINYQPMNLAAAQANPLNVLFCLLAGSKTIASGTEASNTTISGGANETWFSAAL